ncbi:MAG TPA: AsmA family protein [Candidatus Acidoferrales bacterium]|nr:AsmA family protein [Candidatus Acidoferrales bacterium]
MVAAIVCGGGMLAIEAWVGSARMHQRLVARLAAAFGRPVAVADFEMRWFPWPAIEAHGVAIADDPQFGAEYFLRAENVAASVRWFALAGGRLELGTLTFEQPSLNLVRNADGKWNVESWLPRASRNAGPQVPAGSTNVAQTAPRLRRIVIVGGRVNFRRGLDVRPFALTNVTGEVEEQGAGRWRIALAAQPMRATVRMQESGTFWLEGSIAGTSARLQPAELKMTWSGASAADTLRLLTGNDDGIRGTFAMQVSAQTVQAASAESAAVWEIKIGAQAGELHRWDLAQRQDSPGVSLAASAQWQAGSPELNLRQVQIDGARTHALLMGDVNWSGAIAPHLSISTAEISWNDLLAAYRSFSPGVDDALVADGVIRAHAELEGWPLRIVSAHADSAEADITANAVQLARIENAAGKWNAGAGSASAALHLANVASKAGEISSPRETGVESSINFYGSTNPDAASSLAKQKTTPPGKFYEVSARGSLAHVEQVFALARALGRPIESGWSADGGLDVDLAWRWHGGEHIPRPQGSLRARSLALQLPLINHPIELDDVNLALAAGQRSVTVTRAAALGANWQGSIEWQESQSPAWSFDLAADYLDADEIDRWLGPRARPNWLARIFSTAPQQVPVVTPSALHARGKLRIGSFSLQNAEAQDVSARIDLQGRDLTVQELSAKLDGGTVKGALEAKLTSQPAYRFSARIDAVNAAALVRADPALKGRVAGKLTGNVEFSASGIGRDALLGSLEGRGYLSLSGAEIDSLRLAAQSPIAAPNPAARENYTYLQAGFSVGAKEIQLQDLVVAGGNELYLGSGKVDFARRLDLDLHPVPPAYSKAWLSPNEQRRLSDPVTRATRHVRVSGVLEAMQVTQQAAPAAAPALRQ